MSSGASVKINGKTEVTNIVCDSGASFKGDNFSTSTINFNASSGASIKTKVLSEIIGAVSTGASVTIIGNPPYKNVKKSTGGNISYY